MAARQPRTPGGSSRRAHSDLEAPIGHGVEGRQLLGQDRRVAQVVVQHQGADAQLRRLGGDLQPGEGTPVAEMVGRQTDGAPAASARCAI
jgi:hypothetical protein